MVRYLAQVAGGGLLREIEKTVDASTLASRGEKVNPGRLPVVGRFYGEVDDDRTQASRYYEADRKLKKMDLTMGVLKKKATDEEIDAFEAKNPLLEVKRDWQIAKKHLSKLNKAAVETINDPVAMKELDKERTDEMRELNDAIVEMEKASGKVTLRDRVKAAGREMVTQ